MEVSLLKDYDIESWTEVMLVYEAALKQMQTKLEVLTDEFQHVHQYNPIEHIKCRLKTSESIVKKLKRKGYESTIQNMVEYVNDIAGIRIICSFTSDIYKIAEIIAKQPDLTVQYIKDYIANPKESGYRSYHIHVTIPVFLSDRTVETKMEIQIRTVAMDFWASLEHKMKYKLEGNAPENLKQSLRDCSDMVAALDAKMLSLNKEILKLNNITED